MEPKRILIIKPSALGDVALSLPALSSLRASFPQARITWLVRQEFAPLLAGADDLDEVLLFDRKGLGRWWRHPKAFASLMRFFRELRRGRFDLVIDLQGLFRTAFFAWVTGSSRRFGMADAREFAAFFYTHRVVQRDGAVHVIDYHRDIVTAAGADEIATAYHLRVPPGGLERARELLDAQGITSRPYVVLVTGSAHKYKCWPIERFAALADRIDTEFHLPLIAVGGRSEQSAIQELKSLSHVPIVDLAAKTDIPSLAGVLSGAALVISNDTGPGHIAAALETPVVIIFGKTNPLRICPYNKPHGAVAIGIASRDKAIESSDPHHRIEEIDVDRVFSEAAYHLSAFRSPQP